MTTIDRRSFLGLALLAAPVAARADEPEPTGARIARAQARITTLQGPFTQERTIGLMRSVVRSRGTLTLARPDRLRWELAAPDEVVYWVTPEGFAYRSAQGSGRLPATSARLAAALDDVRALLGDISRLRARYDVVESVTEAGATIRATPKEPSASTFKSLTLELAGDLGRPVRATLVESARDKTEITFGDLRVNAPLDAKLLVPPG